MDTSIHSLPIEVLLIIFADLAHSSSPHELLQSALVCRLWSEELLPLLYHSVTLSTEAKIKAFIRRKLKKKQHRVISLSLLIVEPTERLVPRLHWLHRKLVWNLFDSLNGQTLKSLVIGQKTAIPLDIFTHPTLSGLESLNLQCDGYSLENIKDLDLRLKSLSFSGRSLFSLSAPGNPFLKTILSRNSPHDTPTIRHLDLSHLPRLPKNIFKNEDPFKPILPFLSSLALPAIFNIVDDMGEALCELLPLATSLSHLSLSFNEIILHDARLHFNNLLASLPPSLSSLTLRMQDLTKNGIEYCLEDCIIPTVLEIDAIPTSTLSKLKVFRLEGIGNLKMEDVEDGPEFLEKLAAAGILFNSLRGVG